MLTAQKINPSFSIGDVVVYAKNGVGKIEKVVNLDFRGECYSSYAIKMKATGVELFVPTQSAKDMGLRHLKTSKDLDSALKIISTNEEIEELAILKTWKERKKILDEMFKSGSPEDLAKIIKFLYSKNVIKDLPNSERKVYDMAFKFLIHELSEVKGIPETEADHIIAEKLIQSK